MGAHFPIVEVAGSMVFGAMVGFIVFLIMKPNKQDANASLSASRPLTDEQKKFIISGVSIGAGFVLLLGFTAFMILATRR